MSWDDDPNYTPQFKSRDWIWTGLFLVGFFALITRCSSAEAQRYSETSIRECACDGLAQEVRTAAGTYVDCLSDTHAIEIESTSDWAEAIGQSLHYAVETGKRAKVEFFCEMSEGTCLRHILLFESTLTSNDLEIDWDYVPTECLAAAQD